MRCWRREVRCRAVMSVMPGMAGIPTGVRAARLVIHSSSHHRLWRRRVQARAQQAASISSCANPYDRRVWPPMPPTCAAYARRYTCSPVQPGAPSRVTWPENNTIESAALKQVTGWCLNLRLARTVRSQYKRNLTRLFLRN